MIQADAHRLPVDDKHTVFCEIAGQGPPLVLTHDGILHRETWDAQFDAFSSAYRVARWDRRGYGKSDPPDAPYSSVGDLARIATFVSSSPAILMGCSFGSLVSLHCALDHPELVSALVLVGPIVSGLGFTGHFLSRGGRRAGQDLMAGEEIDYWSRSDPWFIAPANAGARDRLRTLLAANPGNIRPKAQEQQPAPPALPRLSQVAVPVLIIVGEHDIADVHAHSGAIEAGIPGARRLVLRDSGHLPQLEVPREFNQAVLSFLDSQR
jgi:pimeloyl-ACP methyl ester carboxylesterase